MRKHHVNLRDTASVSTESFNWSVWILKQFFSFQQEARMCHAFVMLKLAERQGALRVQYQTSQSEFRSLNTKDSLLIVRVQYLVPVKTHHDLIPAKHHKPIEGY